MAATATAAALRLPDATCCDLMLPLELRQLDCVLKVTENKKKEEEGDDDDDDDNNDDDDETKLYTTESK